VRWGILGTGNIARRFAEQLPLSRTGALVAVGSRTGRAADEFAARLAVRPPRPRAHPSYQDLLDDDSVDAVYLATRIRRTSSGRSGPPKPASTCCARSRWRSTGLGRRDDRGGGSS
jgi:hypothetical protein